LSAFDRYFHAPYRGVRAHVFTKVFLAMMALDTWLLMIGHAGRYGVDGFNVAHFAWLDRILPVPSAGLYVGVLLLTGLLALSIALAGSHPWALFALFLLYTFSWSMSMLDSYQHHYFVSTILLCLVFFPRLEIAELVVPPQPASAAPVKANKRARAANRRPSAMSGEAIYLTVCALSLASYALVDSKEHGWLWFAACAGTLAIATWLRSRALRGAKPRLVTGFGYNLLGASVGVLYTFTSIAKMDTQWFAGNTIRRISSAGRVFAPLAAAAAELGIPDQRFWSLVSTSVIPLELLVALGYWVAVTQDASRSRLPRMIGLAAFWLAMSLHVGAEAMQLEIGWFSYYMMLLACTFLLPGAAIEALGGLITRPAQLMAAQLAELDAGAAGKRLADTLISVAAVSLVLAAVAFLIDLPGAGFAAGAAVVALLSLTLHGWLRGNTAHVRRIALGTGGAAALMWGAIAFSDMRWDFYRYLGGDLSRRGQDEAALEAYVKGERYAPKGESRQDKIDKLRQRLGR
jgi:hypothetical protein